MGDIAQLLLQLPQDGRCLDAEITEMTQGYSVILYIFDAVFSMARIPSGLVTDVQHADLCFFVLEALKVWRGLHISVSPEVHAIEDHLSDQMLQFGGIGDVGEDFVEQSHQDGIKDQKR